jgi:hypothetical protein
MFGLKLSVSHCILTSGFDLTYWQLVTSIVTIKTQIFPHSLDFVQQQNCAKLALS